MGRPKLAEPNATQKYGRFTPDVWEKFTGALEKRNVTLQRFMDGVAEDVIDGNYVSLRNLREEQLGELKRSAEEQLMPLDVLVTQIVARYCVERMAERNTKKKKKKKKKK